MIAIKIKQIDSFHFDEADCTDHSFHEFENENLAIEFIKNQSFESNNQFMKIHDCDEELHERLYYKFTLDELVAIEKMNLSDLIEFINEYNRHQAYYNYKIIHHNSSLDE